MNAVGAFSPVEAIHVATVLEDCVDQLIILGRIMPVSFREKPNAVQIVDEELAQLIESQKSVEGSFDHAILQRQGSGSHRAIDMRDDPRVAPIGVSGVQKAGVELRRGTQSFAQALKQNPLTADNLEKVQADRSFVESVLHDTMFELLNRGSFETLAKAVHKEQDKKTQLEQTIQREEDGRKLVKQLQRQLVEVKKEREVELQRRTEMIAHLKDQLQEMKAKTNMEGKYVKNVTDVSVAQTQKKCAQEEDRIRSEIEALKNRIDEENRVNAEIESFLRTHIQKRQDLLQYWIDKHENDVDLKQKELDLLKAAKAKDFERLQELKRLALRAKGKLHKLLRSSLQNKASTISPCHHDVISEILANSGSETTSHDASVDHVIDQALELLFGGQETLSAFVTCLVLLLAKNPHVIEQMSRELAENDSLLDDSEGISVTSLAKLTYFDYVIREVLRLYPPIGGGYRRVIKSFELQGFRIPFNWSVTYSIKATHDSSPFFSCDKEAFRPERWASLQESLPEPGRLWRMRCDYLPFGAGARACVGQRYALQFMRLFSVLLIQRMDGWELVTRDPVMLSVPIIRPEKGLYVSFRRREECGENDR